MTTSCWLRSIPRTPPSAGSTSRRHTGLEVADQAIIHGLVVDESARSGGIGNELVEAAEAWARSRGATTIIVRSRAARRRAHRFYERIGYVEVKVSHTFSKSLV